MCLETLRREEERASDVTSSGKVASGTLVPLLGVGGCALCLAHVQR